MPLSEDLKELSGWLDQLPRVGMQALGGSGAPMFVLDFILIGATKRTLSLGHGFVTMVESKNMMCARALVRMQIDTVSRLLAYTYVANPERMAKEVVGGKKLNKFKCRDGKPLVDGYLIDRMTRAHPWVRTVYDLTSGEVHFSEKQFFAAIHSMDEESRTVRIEIVSSDKKFPEWSWSEVVTCFSKLCEILVQTIDSYASHKAAKNSFKPT
jgi:hypothetical protein